jgi:hypothetical protein
MAFRSTCATTTGMRLRTDHEIIMPAMDMIRCGDVVEVAAEATRHRPPGNAGASVVWTNAREIRSKRRSPPTRVTLGPLVPGRGPA